MTMACWSGSSRGWAHQGLLRPEGGPGLQGGLLQGLAVAAGCCRAGASSFAACRHRLASHSSGSVLPSRAARPYSGRGGRARRRLQEMEQQHQGTLGDLVNIPLPHGRDPGPTCRPSCRASSREDWRPEPCRPARGGDCRTGGACQLEASCQGRSNVSSRASSREFTRNSPWWARGCVQHPRKKFKSLSSEAAGNAIQLESNFP